jgi:hypothetical protein
LAADFAAGLSAAVDFAAGFAAGFFAAVAISFSFSAMRKYATRLKPVRPDGRTGYSST